MVRRARTIVRYHTNKETVVYILLLEMDCIKRGERAGERLHQGREEKGNPKCEALQSEIN
jgi:hypothetical protein